MSHILAAFLHSLLLRTYTSPLHLTPAAVARCLLGTTPRRVHPRLVPPDAWRLTLDRSTGQWGVSSDLTRTSGTSDNVACIGRISSSKSSAEIAKEQAEAAAAEEAAKNAAKKNKRVVRGAVKDANYFHADGEAPASQVDAALADVDLIITKLDHEELATLTGKLNNVKDAAKIKEIFQEEAQRLVGASKLSQGELRALA